MVFVINTLERLPKAQPHDATKTYDRRHLMFDADDAAEAESRFDALRIVSRALSILYWNASEKRALGRSVSSGRIHNAGKTLEHAMWQIRKPLFHNPVQPAVG